VGGTNTAFAESRQKLMTLENDARYNIDAQIMLPRGDEMCARRFTGLAVSKRQSDSANANQYFTPAMTYFADDHNMC
jgi:hypothetical protein